MANLQNYLEEFHQKIRLDAENEDLTASRDAIKERISASINSALTDGDILAPEYFDQGSYAMGTGVKPADGSQTYDIDEGVKFNINPSDYPDPVYIKKLVASALEDHTDLGVEVKMPCVRVLYKEGDTEKYHVDLAIYATNGQIGDQVAIKLARGRPHSDTGNKVWEDAQPELLMNKINNFSTNAAERAQLRRVVRYLKRWKDVQFSSDGNNAPRGIALTVATYRLYAPKFQLNGNPDDVALLVHIVSSILNLAGYVPEVSTGRFSCNLPVAPYNDLFAKMTDKMMLRFLGKLCALGESLAEARSASTDDEACAILAELFGTDFPSAEVAKSTAKITKPRLGYTSPAAPPINYAAAPVLITLDGYLLLSGKRVPLMSNGEVVLPENIIEFQANPDPSLRNVSFLWRVVNTGAQTEHLAGQPGADNPYRGEAEPAHLLQLVGGKLKHVDSRDPLINQESTAYTGKHWIECLATDASGTCIAKSAPFYVNVYNEEFREYVA